MTGLSRTDLSVIEGDALIADTRISDVLGYGRVDEFRRLIRNHSKELQSYGEVFRRTGGKIGRGRPTTTYYLNEGQALLACMFSRTPRAAEARQQIIEVFMAWRRGELSAAVPVPPNPTQDVFKFSAERSGHVVNHLDNIRAMDDLALNVARLPIWPSGRRPRWWHDLEVREFLTLCHRQMGCLEAQALGRDRFGARCPGKSTINLYWQRLDRVFGLPQQKPRLIDGGRKG